MDCGDGGGVCVGGGGLCLLVIMKDMWHLNVSPVGKGVALVSVSPRKKVWPIKILVALKKVWPLCNTVGMTFVPNKGGVASLSMILRKKKKRCL